jgi:hypothetical protein
MYSLVAGVLGVTGFEPIRSLNFEFETLGLLISNEKDRIIPSRSNHLVLIEGNDFLHSGYLRADLREQSKENWNLEKLIPENSHVFLGQKA